ncbi:carboxypeptidase-like regulatory domain-containing protein [Croceiramulus getboli]|nr:carboxypeptidase-like regulatory domain-containing protein [Flavobacteriaceae bacterium YJPT1-3]
MRLLFYLGLICVSFTLYAQTPEFISGQLLDAQTAQPIPFATIKIKNENKGLISNEDGGFRVPLNFKERGDTLVISFIGYTTREVLLSELDTTQINRILLKERIEQLGEVRLRTRTKPSQRLRSAKDIVNRAIKDIPLNYPQQPFSYLGYYRDYQKKGAQYLNLNEALLEVFDLGFGSIDFHGTQTRIYRYENNANFPKDSLAARPYDYINKNKVIDNAVLDNRGGNEYTLLRLHDAIRNHQINSFDYVNKLSEDFIEQHEFEFLPPSSVNEVPLYAIKLQKSIGNIRVQGTIYISQTDFKIYKLEYRVRESANNIIVKGMPDRQDPSSGRTLYEIIVEYQEREGLMYPNYISFFNTFKVLQPPKFTITDVRVNLEERCFELQFNTPPDPDDAVKKRFYRLAYQGVRMRLDRAELRDQTVLLYPKDPELIFDPKRIVSLQRLNGQGLTVDVRSIEDTQGNKIFVQSMETYNQYREFFVQELKLNPFKPLDNRYMRNTQPMHRDQPIVELDNIDEYWLNTPLKN